MSHDQRHRTHVEFETLTELDSVEQRTDIDMSASKRLAKRQAVVPRDDRHRVHQILHSVERDPLHEEVDGL